MSNKSHSLTAWIGMVPRRLWMAVVVLVLLAAFALAFAPTTIARAGMAPGGSRIITVNPNGMAPGGS